MRALPLLGALALGLGLCGQAAAQNAHNLYTNNYSTNASSSILYEQNYGRSIKSQTRPTRKDSLPSKTLTESRFSLTDLFTRVPTSVRANPNTFSQPIPNPDNAEVFLSAFGYRRFGGRR